MAQNLYPANKKKNETRIGKFCKYYGNKFKVNRDSDGNTIIRTKNDKIIDSTFREIWKWCLQ